MEKNINDDKIKDFLSGSKLKASDNLKYRIMQQIETEQALLSKKKVKSKATESIFQNMLPVFGVMYALIIAIAVGVYATSGTEGVMSTTFFAPVIMIVTICSAYLGITFLDNKRREKHN